MDLDVEDIDDDQHKIQAAALEYGLDGMDLDVEDSGAGEDVQVELSFDLLLFYFYFSM